VCIDEMSLVSASQLGQMVRDDRANEIVPGNILEMSDMVDERPET